MRLVLMLGLCISTPALAQAPVRASYTAYSHLFPVMDMDATLTVTPGAYSVHLLTRTVGAVRVFYHTDMDTTVNGAFAAGRPQPQRYYSTGRMGGEPRVTLIEYRGQRPELRTLLPPNASDNREDVPPADTVNTVDALSAMAMLVQQVTASGRCDGSIATYDGRRLSRLAARTVGEETLEKSSRSSFAGPALRCDFDGRQVAGFTRDDDVETERQPHKGSAWFARVVPGGPVIPVRVVFTNRLLGEATLYLTSAAPQ